MVGLCLHCITLAGLIRQAMPALYKNCLKNGVREVMGFTSLFTDLSRVG